MATEPDPGHPAPPATVRVEPEKLPEPLPPPPPGGIDTAFRPWFYAKLLALLFFVSYSIAFVVGNDKTITIDFVFATARVSLIWTILLLLAVGLAGGALLAQLARHRRSKQRREP
jgi:uncharacterized integral membrane protein